MRYQSMQDDNGKFYINLYWQDEGGMTRRETLYSDMLEHEADDLCASLNRCRAFLHDLPNGVTLENILDQLTEPRGSQLEEGIGI